MWIMALLWWKRPRLAQNVIAAWLIVMAAAVTITAPGQLFLRYLTPDSPQIRAWIPEWALWAGVPLGPAVAIAVCVLLDRRADA